MGKIKELFHEQKVDVKEVFFKYISTIIAVFCACIVVILDMDIGSSSGDTVEQIMTFFVIYAAGSFFIETLFNNNRVIMYVINAFVSFVLTIFAFNLDDWISTHALETYVKYFVLYILIILGISFYVIIKNSGLSFQKYVTTVLLSFVKWGFIFIVLNLGIVVILGIFNSLILRIDVFEIVTKMELLFTGIIYFPYALICILAKKEDRSKFYKVVAKYILMPILLIAIAIIYLYIVKMVFTLSVPKNEVFGICSMVFCFGFVINIMAYSYLDVEDEDSPFGRPLTTYEKVIKYLKYAFIPMVILEIYSIGIRIGDYGLTEDRYMGVIFIIAQIIYLAWEPIDKFLESFRKEKNKEEESSNIPGLRKSSKAGYGRGYEKFIFVVIILYIFVFLVPVTSVEYTCYRSQRKRMEQALNRQDYVTAMGAYNVLRYNSYGEKYIDEKYTNEDIENLHTYYYEIKTGDNQYNAYGVYINPSYSTSDINIKGYSKMYKFSVNDYQKEDMKNMNLQISLDNFDYNNKNYLEINDLSDVIERALKDYGYNQKERGYNYNTTKPQEFMYDSNIKIIISNIRFSYYEDGSTIGDLYMEGYILVK